MGGQSEKIGEDVWMLKVAALVDMMPHEIKDTGFKSVEDKDQDYNKLKQRIFAWVANKASAQGGIAPMEIGRVGYCDGDDGKDGDVDINGVNGNTTCFKCGGWGHMSKECPTKKGKRKGAGKEKGREPKGKGKGSKRTCWRCGKAGHRAMECDAMDIGGIDEKGTIEEVLVGTVWNVGGAEEIDTKDVVWTLEEMGEEVDEDSEDYEDEKIELTSGSEDDYGWWLEEPWDDELIAEVEVIENDEDEHAEEKYMSEIGDMIVMDEDLDDEKGGCEIYCEKYVEDKNIEKVH